MLFARQRTPRSQRRSRMLPPASPEDCGINSVIYWQAAARRCTSFAKVR